jgi:hypothetical protein
MNDITKAAYRHLLYVALVGTRNSCHTGAKISRSPIVWYRQYQRSRVAGAVADWLHNLSQFSSLDFEHFEEQRFWEEHSALCRAFPGERLERYRIVFDDYLTGKVHVCL